MKADEQSAIALEMEGEELLFYPLEQVRLAGNDYLLVTDAPDGDGEALILKDLSDPESEEAVYEVVEDEKILEALTKMFTDELSGEGIVLE